MRGGVQLGAERGARRYNFPTDSSKFPNLIATLGIKFMPLFRISWQISPERNKLCMIDGKKAFQTADTSLDCGFVPSFSNKNRLLLIVNVLPVQRVAANKLQICRKKIMTG